MNTLCCIIRDGEEAYVLPEHLTPGELADVEERKKSPTARRRFAARLGRVRRAGDARPHEPRLGGPRPRRAPPRARVGDRRASRGITRASRGIPRASRGIPHRPHRAATAECPTPGWPPGRPSWLRRWSPVGRHHQSSTAPGSTPRGGHCCASGRARPLSSGPCWPASPSAPSGRACSPPTWRPKPESCPETMRDMLRTTAFVLLEHN